MKKILIAFTLLNTFILANINVAVSILPEETFVKAIGGEKVDVALMVLPGNSPHTYEPKPSQMRAIATAQIYFAIGVEFEHNWLPRFADLNPAMKIVRLDAHITKLPMQEAHHHHESTAHDDDDDGLDPHIWTSPKNVERIAQEIYRTLVRYDGANADYYTRRFHAFLAKIKETDTRIRTILSSLPKGSAFMVFHPSWGYFAHAYGLRQIPVEVEGKEPSPKALVSLIKKARKEKVHAIFTQPEFSDKAAHIIAMELHIPVIKVSPLAKDWSSNMIRIANAIAGADQ